MIMPRTLFAGVLLGVFALPAAAQAVAPCGLGRAFGITEFHAGGMSGSYLADSADIVFTFSAEPVILAVTTRGTNRLRAGDVVVALNKQPITSRAGADLFAYPSGEVVLTVRRNGANLDVEHSFATAACRPQPYPLSYRSRLTFSRSGPDSTWTLSAVPPRTGTVGAAAGGRGGRSGAAVAMGTQSADALRQRLGAAYFNPADSARVRSSVVALRNFGLTLACDPQCARATHTDGSVYWRFSGYPTVAAQGALRDGAAARAGIRDGDVLISVNGHTPMSDEGARLLSQSERELTLTLEFSRGGTRSTYRLRL